MNQTLTAWMPRALLGGAFLSFFLFTIALYFWGPWQYPMEAPGIVRLLIFLLAAHTAFVAGYVFGVRGEARPSRHRWPVGRIVLAASILELLMLFPASFYYTGNWIPNPLVAVNDIGDAYLESRVARAQNEPYVNYLRILFAPLLACAIPLGVFYWNQLGRVTRTLFAASVICTFCLYVSMGTNAAAGQWMALFPWFVIASCLAGVGFRSWRALAAASTVQIASVVIFALVFAFSMADRHGSYVKWGVISGINAQLEREPPAPAEAAPAAEPPPAAPTPVWERPVASMGADGFAAYLTQGYYAVYLSLGEPFVPTWGLGHSMFLARQYVRLTGDESVITNSYPERIAKYGWKPKVYWATIYPWLASDVTFPGTVVIIGLLGFLAGRLWLDVLGGRNPVAVAFLGQLLMMLYYIPAHNKVMQGGEGVLAFWSLGAIWIWSRRRQTVPADVAVGLPPALHDVRRTP